MLEVEGLVSGYGSVTVLRGVAMRVEPGEIVSIVGANGAGKSTLLRTISGLIRAREGRIRFHGVDIGGKAMHHIVASGLVQVPEGRQLFPTLTVNENLLLGAFARAAWQSRHALRRDLEKQVYPIFPILAERRDQLAGTLSGGQQQMLAIGRALMARPRMLILDEPSLGLAPLVVEELFSVVQRLRNGGMPSLLVEQNARAAAAFSDRVYVLRQGTVVAEGTGADMLRNETLFSEYLGTA
ncbi:MAG: ABC transporter ATP-binding protein [Anaerolineales bacterium]|nr:ABC transporter ATP-binding protein [Alphaproteobacteria bacterium]MCW5886783.1 ABC transporter ATP-binding protein [Anaerolineales bacterium]